jgi:hypothetical protein
MLGFKSSSLLIDVLLIFILTGTSFGLFFVADEMDLEFLRIFVRFV